MHFCWMLCNNRMFSGNKDDQVRQSCTIINAEHSGYSCNKHVIAACTLWFPLILSWKSSRSSSYAQQRAPELSHESRNLLLSWFQVVWRLHVEGFNCRRKRRRRLLFIISALELYNMCLQQSTWSLPFIFNSQKCFWVLFCSSLCSTKSHRGQVPHDTMPQMM